MDLIEPEGTGGAWEAETDVVVVGYGCAGASAAIEAREAGAEVMVLERAGGHGGASAMAGGEIYLGGGTSLQTACGFEDDPDAMAAFLMAAMGPGANEARIDLYSRGSVAHFDWLCSLGLPFKASLWDEPAWKPPTDDGLMWMGEASHPFSEIARPAPRGHRPRTTGAGGALLMAHLAARVEALGATVRADTRVVRLVVGSDGRVVGVVARHAGADVRIRARRGVVLTAGGFVFNDELLAQHAPELVGHRKVGTDGDDGSGITMAQALGAQTQGMAGGQAAIAVPPALLFRSILVNAAGSRFINEDTYPGRVGQAALFHQGGTAYLVTDAETYESLDDKVRAQRRPTWVCETVEELEATIGLPAGALVATVDLYNRHAEQGTDPVWHKQPRWVRPLRAPFGAIDVCRSEQVPGADAGVEANTGYSVFTIGGLRTTLDGEVLHVSGDPIAGLYAAGRTTAGLQAWGYISGTSLGDGTFFGRRAGTAAAGATR